MPRKRRASISSIDDNDFSTLDEKYSKDDLEGRAPRNAANARERARMRVLSKAFCRLKTTLPWVPADTKLSKLDTLRLAATYIAHLRAVLQEDRNGYTESSRSLSLTLSWPFAFQSASTPSMLLNDSCSMSTTSGMTNTNKYYHRAPQHDQMHDVEFYHSESHQNFVNRHNNHEPHQMYY